MTPAEIAIGQSLPILAQQCCNPALPLKRQVALDRLCEIFEDAPTSFEDFAEPFINLERNYQSLVPILRRFMKETREMLHAALKAEMEYRRFASLIEHYDKTIGAMQAEIDEKSHFACDLQQRLANKSGHKTKQRNRREEILQRNVIHRNKMHDVLEMRRITEERINQARPKANLTKAAILKKLNAAEKECVSKVFEWAKEREGLRCEYFIANGWFLLLIDCQAQIAFDRIIRHITPPPLSIWQWACCCFRR